MIERNGIYLITSQQLADDGCLGQSGYDNAVKAGMLTVVQKAKGNAPALVDWASMPEAIKTLAKKHLGGEPAEVVAAQIVERHMVLTPEDEQHIEGFKSTNGLGLSPDKRRELKRAAGIMNLLATLDQVMKEGGTRKNAAIISIHKELVAFRTPTKQSRTRG